MARCVKYSCVPRGIGEGTTMSAASLDIRLGEGTRGRIIEELAVAPRTARDLARSLGIQESAARGHLDRLEQRGLVLPTFHKEGVGRPRKRYALMLDSVLEELLARQGAEFVSSIFADAARRMALQIVHKIPPRAPPAERAEALAAALNELGFRCIVETDPDGSLKIIRTNCVFRHNALTHSYLICEVFDKHLTEALLGEVGLDLKDSITRGATRCTHLIQLR